MTFDVQQAQVYLAKVCAWPEPNDQGWVNIHYTILGQGYTKPTWRGTPCRTMSEAVNTLNYIANNPDTRDVYACMSRQARTSTKTGKAGRQFLVAERHRDDALALKSFFLDVDFKDYATEHDAIVALAGFLSKTKMPKPSLLVQSGGGLHVYWCLASALTVAQWQPLASALAEATKQNGLKCDTQCTVDAARVLRVAGTWNRKKDPARPVKVGTPLPFDYNLEPIAEALAPYIGVTPTHARSNQVKPSTSFLVDPSLFTPRAPLAHSALGAGLEKEFAPVRLDDVAAACPFIKGTLVTGGRDNSNPLWNLTNLLATFTEGGASDAHLLGQGHPAYTKEETDEQFARKVREQKEKGLGWPACKSFSEAGAKQCATCIHFGKGKSPVHFAITPAVLGVVNGTISGAGSVPAGVTSVALQPDYDVPEGYFRDENKFIKKLVQNPETGETVYVPITNNPMWDPIILRVNAKEHHLNFSSIVDQKIQRIEMPLEIIGTDGVRQQLQKQAVMCPTYKGGIQEVSEFMKSWKERLEMTQRYIESVPYGWDVRNGTASGFVYSGKLWTPTDELPASTPDPSVANQYRVTGDPDPWRIAMKMITDQKRPALEAIVAAAFGAPLVHFSGEAGPVLCAYSPESGIGKSTALHVGQAVWGDPVNGIALLDDTSNYSMKKLQQIRSLPLYWDELKASLDTDKFVKDVFQVSLGRGKGRMKANTTLAEPGAWRTIFVACSNSSLLDYVQGSNQTTPAGVMRVFEFRVPPNHGVGQLDSSVAGRMKAALDYNFGHIGAEYAKFLGRNHVAIGKEFADYHDALGKEIKAIPEERFWIATIASMLMGTEFANRLGFANFDVPALKAFLLKNLALMRARRQNGSVDLSKDAHISDILNRWLNLMSAQNTLFTDRIHTGPGRPKPGAISVDHRRTPAMQQLGVVYVHISVTQKIMRFSQAKFFDWLKHSKLERQPIVEALETKYGAKKILAKLGGGVLAKPQGQENVFEIDFSNEPTLDMLD